MSAVYLMEIKDYKNALDYLLKTKIIYDKISNYKDTLEAIIYKERASQLDTLIRLCAFNITGLQKQKPTTENEEESLITNMLSSYS